MFTVKQMTSYLLITLMSLLLWPQIMVAQEKKVNLTGVVQDEQKKGLPSANVRLLSNDGTLYKGVSTNEHGQFTIAEIKPAKYTLVVSFVGYKTHQQSITITEQGLNLGNIRLAEDGKSLGEVVVKGKVAEVMIKGDTLEYNAGSYTTIQGAVLKDLIKQLPGATINEQGQITINGKVISQIMVDGKRFFENDTKIAVNNLPAEIVDKVQVLSKDSDQARMTGFTDGEEETVINLTIKSGMKKGLFGTAFVGGGTKQRYEANALVNRFANDDQWTILGSMNNTNNAGSTDISTDASQSDLMRSASGGGRQGNPGGRSTNNDGITTSRLLGANATHVFSSALSMGGNGFYGNNDKLQTTKSSITNLLPTGNTLENGNTTERNNKHNVGTNLRMEWKLDDKTELVLSPRLSYGWATGNYSSETEMLNADNSQINSGQTNQNTESRILSTQVHGDISRKLSSLGRTISLSFSGRYGQDNTDGLYQSVFSSLVDPTQNLDINQKLDSKKNNSEVRARFTYVEPLTKVIALQLYYQFKNEWNTSTRDAYDYVAASQSYSLLNSLYSNDFSSSFTSHSVGIALKHKGAKHDVTFGVNVNPSSLHSQTISGGRTYDPINRSVVNFSPSLRISYKPRKGTDMRVDYFGRSFQPTSDQLSPVEDVTNPLVQYVGNQSLNPGFKHNLFGRFNTFMSKTQSSLNLFLHLTYTQNDIVSKTTYDTSGKRTITYTNVDGNMSAGLGGFYNTPIWGKRISVRFSTMNNLSRQVGFVQGERNNALSLTLSEGLSFTYRNDWINSTLGGNWKYNNVSNSLANVTAFTTHDYEANWTNTLTLPLNFSAEGELRYLNNTGYSTGFDQQQWLVNLGLAYSFLPSNAATLRLKVYDVLGQKRNIYRSVTATSISSEESNVLGQYAMLHFIYRFNSFSSNASASDMKRSFNGGPGGGPGGPPLPL